MSGSLSADDLLFGVVALQMELITRDQLADAVRAWLANRQRTLADILREQGVLDSHFGAIVNELAQHFKEINNGDATRSFAKLSAAHCVHQIAEDLGAPDLSATIDIAPPLSPLGDGQPPTLHKASRFRVLRYHAEGGFGIVSLAADHELNREVAFKELKPRFARDPGIRDRFLMEAEITGRLEHPGVVPVYGLGHHADGRPFYAMKFVRGDNLKDAITRLHAASHGSGDRETWGLELRRLLGRFIDVCNAVDYAHSRGILHRDIKPGNIMLGRFGETLVMDWGLAKAIGAKPVGRYGGESTLQPALGGSSSATQAGSAVGTPLYMSPEQAMGEIDKLGPATDVYSLGATLYHLLVGRPPFAESPGDEITQRVSEGRFLSPSHLNPRVPKPLEAVCCKAMARRPADRYASPGALADDIERWLADERLAAYPESFVERLGRWARRHRTWVRAGAATLVVVLVIAIASAWLINRAKNEAVRLADANRILVQQEQHARDQAVARLREAREAVDLWLTGASALMQYQPGAQTLRQRLLEKAAEDYEAFAAQKSADRDLEIERARAYSRLGDVHRLLRNVAAAEKAYRSGETILQELLAATPRDDAVELELAKLRVQSALLLVESGKREDAHRGYEAAIARIASLAKAHDGAAAYEKALAGARANLAGLLIEEGRRPAALDLLRAAASAYETLLLAEPESTACRAELATVRSLVGDIQLEEGQHAEAVKNYKDALQQLDQVVVKNQNDPQLRDTRAAVTVALAAALRKAGETADEKAAYQRAIADYEQLATSLPDTPRYRENLALTRSDLGQLLYELQEARAAQVELEKAVETFRGLSGSGTSLPRYLEAYAACRDIMGEVLADMGLDEDSRDAHKAACEIYKNLVATNADIPQYRHREAVCLSHLGYALTKLEQYDDAEEALNAAREQLASLTIADAQVPQYHADAAAVLENMAELVRRRDAERDAKAVQTAYRDAAAAWDNVVRQWPTPEHFYHAGRFLACLPNARARDTETAIQRLTRATAAAPRNPLPWRALGFARLRRGDLDEARVACEHARQLQVEPHAADLILDAILAYRKGDVDIAVKHEAAARELLDKTAPQNRLLLRFWGELTAARQQSASPGPSERKE